MALNRSRKVNRDERRRELIAALKALVKIEGPDVTLLRFAEHLGRSDRYVVLYCGSWADLREAAGLPRKRKAGYTCEQLIDVLQSIEQEHGEPVSRRQFQRLTGISAATCERHFGSWREFRGAAGLTEMAAPGTRARYTRDDLLRMMREQLPILGSSMTRNQFAEATGVSTATMDRLGNWGALRLELGLTRRGNARTQAFLGALGIELCDDPPLLFDRGAETNVNPPVHAQSDPSGGAFPQDAQ